MADITCAKFTDYLSRKTEHLDDNIIRSMHPIDTWIGTVAMAQFKAEDGVEHTFDRFENVFPDLRGQWEDVQATSCVGKPCDPDETKIGLGFTRDSYRLQRKSYSTDIFCFDLILSADRAKQQFAHIIKTLRRASQIINSHRLKTEALRIAKFKWATAGNTLVPITATWDASMTYLTVSTLPTSLLSAHHLQRRVQPQIRAGALGDTLDKNMPPMLEYVTAMDEIWNLQEGNPELSDKWRFRDFDDTETTRFYRYGWTGKIGNYGLRDDTFQLRFNIVQQNADGSWLLNLVLPYTNVAATEGIKEDVNAAFDQAPIKIDFIHNRKAMIARVRDTTSINPEMPFAMRDFAGKWQFAMNNITCGVDVNNNPVAVDNSRRNKGKFLADFSYATQAEFPEFEEAFVTLRQEACVIDVPRCQADPGYPTQNYSSANEECATSPITITFTPILDTNTGTYEVPLNSITCNGIEVVHDPITGTSTRANLVAQLNSLIGALGTWAVGGGSTITLVTTACQTVGIPWSVA